MSLLKARSSRAKPVIAAARIGCVTTHLELLRSVSNSVGIRRADTRTMDVDPDNAKFEGFRSGRIRYCASRRAPERSVAGYLRRRPRRVDQGRYRSAAAR